MYFGSVVIVPLWLQTNMGYTSPLAGIAVAPLGIAPVLLVSFIPTIMAKFGKLIPLFFSFLLFALSSFYTAYFTTDVDIWHVAFSRFLMGCGFVFFITPLIALSVQDIPKEKAASAAGIFHFVRAICGGIGTSLFTTLWLRRGYYHHERLGSALTSYTDNTKEFFSTLTQAGIPQEQTRELLNITVDNQAALLSINDCFYLMDGFLALCVLLLAQKASQSTLL
jgi:DHA2 family multidrug resistance protein